MVYRLGAVGFGHWFERLYAGIKNNGSIKLTKVAGVGDIKNKLGRLKAVDLSYKNYYRISPQDPLPSEFLESLDIVHISDPNEYHAKQTIQSLQKGKAVITEKTWGVDKQEFDSVVDFIKRNNLEGRAYLHLHYLHKVLTLELEELLEMGIKRYGKVRSVIATFFEPVRVDDVRRSSWLFSQKSGGLFMDWIHPFEVISFGAKAESIDLSRVKLHAVNTDYDSQNPTGILAEAVIKGVFFSGEAKAHIRIAKGSPYDKKSMRFIFGHNNYLDVNFIDSDIEFITKKRGDWKLFENDKLVESGNPSGKNTSEFLANDILALCEGRRVGLGIEELQKIFKTQWQYQKMIAGMQIERNQEEINSFINDGIKYAM